MKPLKQNKIKFINKCNCLVDYTLLEDAMVWYSGSNTLMSTRVIYMHGVYPAVSIYNEKIHVHRIIAMFKEKTKIVSSIHAHHKDGNKLNASYDNIELISANSHLSHHNKGRKFTEEHKKKISNANRKRAGMKLKRKYNIPISEISKMINEGLSIRKIAIHYGCDWSVIKLRINENPELLTTNKQ